MRRASVRAGAIVAAMGFVGVVAACQSLLGIEGAVVVTDAGSAHDAASPLACGIATNSTECGTCIAAHCCDPASACALDPACSQLQRCLIACTDYGCRAQCLVDHPTGALPEVPALDQCIVTQCEQACGISCGVIAPAVGGDAGDSCEACVVANNCNASEACARDLGCVEIAQCFFACSTPDCQTGCLTNEGDASPGLFASFAFGTAISCSGECGLGDDWNCLGKEVIGTPKSKEIALTVSIVNPATSEKTSGASVKACATNDRTCASPVASGTTDAQGQTVLTIPSGLFGFNGYLDVSSPEIEPLLYFFSYVLTAPQSTTTVYVSRPSDLANLTSTAGVELDPSRGEILLQTNDCQMVFAADVVVSADGIDAKSTLLYYQGSLLSRTATATDKSGFAYVVNAPTTSSVTLHTTPRAVGRVSSSVSVFVRAGTTSFVVAIPNQ